MSYPTLLSISSSRVCYAIHRVFLKQPQQLHGPISGGYKVWRHRFCRTRHGSYPVDTVFWVVKPRIYPSIEALQEPKISKNINHFASSQCLVLTNAPDTHHKSNYQLTPESVRHCHKMVSPLSSCEIYPWLSKQSMVTGFERKKFNCWAFVFNSKEYCCLF